MLFIFNMLIEDIENSVGKIDEKVITLCSAFKLGMENVKFDDLDFCSYIFHNEDHVCII